MADNKDALSEQASEVGVTPRLRSLRPTQDPEANLGEGGSLRPVSASWRASSLASEGESTRSLLRARAASVEPIPRRVPLKHSNASKVKQAALIAVVVIGFAAAAFYAGVTVGGRKASPLQSEFTAGDTALEQAATLDSKAALESAAKASKASSEPAAKEPPPATKALPKSTLAAATTATKTAAATAGAAEYSAAGALRNRTLAANISLTGTPDGRQAKIYLAELGAKYNKDLLEATILLSLDGVSMASQKRPSETAADLISKPFGEQQGESDAAPRDIAPNLLDVLFFSQLQTSPLRTTNQSEADVIFIGFWVHKLVKLDKEIEKPNKHDLAMIDFWKEAKKLLPYLGKKPHVLVVPDKEADLRGTCGGRGLTFLCNPLAQHVTILTPEMLTGKSSIMTGSRISPGIIGSLLDPNSVAVPEASGIHLSPSSPHWAPKFDPEEVLAGKTKLAAVAMRARTPLRKALRANCLAQPTKCTHADPPAIIHRDGPAFAATVFELFQDAWFCLQPPGDTALRVSLWHCILAGSIPVMFDAKALEILPFADVINWQEMLILVTPDQVQGKKKDIISLLESKYGIEDRLSRLAKLQSVRHLFQYSLAPRHYLVHLGHLEEVTEQDDALTMSLKSLFRRLCAHKQLAPRRCS